MSVWCGVIYSRVMAKTSSTIGCREKQPEWKKRVDGLRAVQFRCTAFVYGSLHSAAPPAVSIIDLEHKGNKMLELGLRTRELLIIIQQKKCIVIYTKLGCSWIAEGRCKSRIQSPALTRTTKIFILSDTQGTKKRKRLQLRFCRSLALAVYEFSWISVI